MRSALTYHCRSSIRGTGARRTVLARPASSIASTSTKNALNYCVQLVSQKDRERYLCNLHAPEAARPGLFAIHAFNIETAHIRTATKQETAALGRFSWWRSALGKSLDGTPPEHPVALALAHVHTRYGLTPRYLTQLLDAREADMLVKQPRDRDELQLYSERTAGAMLLLGLECAGVKPGDCEAAEHAASQAGIALGIATLLRGTAAHAAQGCTYLPAEVTTRHGVKLSAMLRGEVTPPVCDAMAEVADEAVAHLLAARSLRDDVPKAARSVLLPATLADHILRNLQRHGYSPFAAGAQAPAGGPSLQMSLLWQRWMASY